MVILYLQEQQFVLHALLVVKLVLLQLHLLFHHALMDTILTVQLTHVQFVEEELKLVLMVLLLLELHLIVSLDSTLVVKIVMFVE